MLGHWPGPHTKGERLFHKTHLLAKIIEKNNESRYFALMYLVTEFHPYFMRIFRIKFAHTIDVEQAIRIYLDSGGLSIKNILGSKIENM